MSTVKINQAPQSTISGNPTVMTAISKGLRAPHQIIPEATITIAIVGLIASLLVPMAYCRYGCPTGAMLEFLRMNAKSDRWTRRDWVALGLAGLALALWLI